MTRPYPLGLVFSSSECLWFSSSEDELLLFLESEEESLSFLFLYLVFRGMSCLFLFLFLTSGAYFCLFLLIDSLSEEESCLFFRLFSSLGEDFLLVLLLFLASGEEEYPLSLDLFLYLEWLLLDSPSKSLSCLGFPFPVLFLSSPEGDGDSCLCNLFESDFKFFLILWFSSELLSELDSFPPVLFGFPYFSGYWLDFPKAPLSLLSLTPLFLSLYLSRDLSSLTLSISLLYLSLLSVISYLSCSVLSLYLS